MIQNQSGQVITEFSLVTLFITLPILTGGAAWFKWEFNKASAAYQSFSEARQALISTGEVSQFPVQIEGMSENVKLTPLEDLDEGDFGLGLEDLGAEVSQLSEDSSRYYRRLQELASTKSSQGSTISSRPKSPSIDALVNSSSN